MDHMRRAVEELREVGTIESISGLYETEPVGGPAQESFLNAVVLLETDLPAQQLLAALQEIETAHGRVRTERWGPRTLDLDIVAVDEEPIVSPDLEVPHPRAAERRFVLEPLSQVWPEAIVGEGLTAAEAVGLLRGQRIELIATTW
jgi:2-amino-4-hydroxy-6-hydroxymethyldihydropteridine diphosphokinase